MQTLSLRRKCVKGYFHSDVSKNKSSFWQANKRLAVWTHIIYFQVIWSKNVIIVLKKILSALYICTLYLHSIRWYLTHSMSENKRFQSDITSQVKVFHFLISKISI